MRVLADGLGSSETSEAFWETLRSPAVEVRIFHPLFARFFDAAFRDHRKILVTDCRVAFTGGMNIGEEYGSSRRSIRRTLKGRSWRDTQVRVEGPTAWEIAVVFGEGWERAGGEPLDLPSLDAEDAPGCRVLTLDTRPGRGVDELASILTALVAAARRRVWITNSYFAPRRHAIETLTRAVGRGVDVRLLLPGQSDVPLIRHAGHGFFAELLLRGVRVFEYQPAILHAKTLVVDGRVCVVGSTNLDYRSFAFNAECNLVILCEETTAALAAAFENDLARTRPRSSRPAGAVVPLSIGSATFWPAACRRLSSGIFERAAQPDPVDAARAATFWNTWAWPPGQMTSSFSTAAASPSPKWSGRQCPRGVGRRDPVGLLLRTPSRRDTHLRAEDSPAV